ncbi:MAG: membrane integrity-associated transporter subunit PqiC [Deltaproteobacteria bacterium]|nr:membrane integrity-associated transporter subunit PqiC [Deltaproteobacteria bacterium]
MRRARALIGGGGRLGLVALSALLATGCLGRSPEVHHYMLGTLSGAEAPAPLEPGLPEVSILVGPVRLPAYLDRSELARLAPSGEVELDAQHRWLGSFETNCLRAISLGLARRLGSTRVVTHPSKAPFPIEYTVRLHIDDLVVEAGGAMRVQIRWALVGPAHRGTGPIEGPPARLFRFEQRREGVGRSPEDRVRAHEAVLDELAGRIASEILAAETGS